MAKFKTQRYSAEVRKRKEFIFYSVEIPRLIFTLLLFRKINNKTRVPGLLDKQVSQCKVIKFVSLGQLLTSLSPKGKICKRQIPSQGFG